MARKKRTTRDTQHRKNAIARTQASLRAPSPDVHKSARTGWLRAAVLGSNDAIVSTASLLIGVSASAASKEATLVAGVAALAAGAMSMAAGEYVSVSSQRDAEQADIEIEKRELQETPQQELRELQQIYEKRGLDKALARQVAEALSKKDELEAHLRDELGIDRKALAQPLQAAWTSALSFSIFAALPIGAMEVAPPAWRIPIIAAVSLTSLTALGALGAHLGGAPLLRASLRVLLGGALAMAVTALVGHVLGVTAS
ncbi:MAG TPA: VIT family protein [Myxococcota bacterium]|jgi:VIT1/CCC1 family predicted Fe2+/Mn2+ transporter